MSDRSPQQLAEEQVAQAIAILREHVPANFILIRMESENVHVMGAFSLESAQSMLKGAIEQVSHQYAYKRATGKLPPP